MESFEYIGVWWLPDNEEQKLYGKLSFSKESINLELDDSFSKKIEYPKGFSNIIIYSHPPLILGWVESGKTAVTLYRCQGPTLQNSYYADFVIVGRHFNTLNEAKIETLIVEVSEVEDWWQFYGTSVKHTHHQNTNKYEHEITLSHADDLTIEIEDKKIEFWHRWTTSQRQTKFEAQQQVTIAFTMKEPCLLEDFLFKHVSQVTRFIGLGLGRVITPKSIRSSISPPYSVFYRIHLVEKNRRPLQKEEMLFAFTDLKDDLQFYFNNWFSKYSKLESVFDLYFLTLLEIEVYSFTSTHFLLLMQAVEAYHRALYDGSYVSEEEYRNTVYPLLKAAIPSQLSNDFKQKLRSTFTYAYQYSLRKRLKEIFNIVLKDHQDFLLNLINDQTSKSPIEHFRDKLVDLRNYYTHYSDDKGQFEEIDILEVLTLYRKVKAILEVCLLVEIGFSTEKIRELIARNRRFQYLKTQ